jgi:hypothetical protein
MPPVPNMSATPLQSFNPHTKPADGDTRLAAKHLPQTLSCRNLQDVSIGELLVSC